MTIYCGVLSTFGFDLNIAVAIKHLRVWYNNNKYKYNIMIIIIIIIIIIFSITII